MVTSISHSFILTVTTFYGSTTAATGCWKRVSSSSTPIPCIGLSTLPNLSRFPSYLHPDPTVPNRCSLPSCTLRTSLRRPSRKCLHFLFLHAFPETHATCLHASPYSAVGTMTSFRIRRSRNRGSIGDPSPEVKRPRRETDHSPPPRAEVKHVRGYTSIPTP